MNRKKVKRTLKKLGAAGIRTATMPRAEAEYPRRSSTSHMRSRPHWRWLWLTAWLRDVH